MCTQKQKQKKRARTRSPKRNEIMQILVVTAAAKAAATVNSLHFVRHSSIQKKSINFIISKIHLIFSILRGGTNRLRRLHRPCTRVCCAKVYKCVLRGLYALMMLFIFITISFVCVHFILLCGKMILTHSTKCVYTLPFDVTFRCTQNSMKFHLNVALAISNYYSGPGIINAIAK